MSRLGFMVNLGGRFSKNDAMPSRQSADVPHGENDARVVHS
jgi:hypothetical protein